VRDGDALRGVCLAQTTVLIDGEPEFVPIWTGPSTSVLTVPAQKRGRKPEDDDATVRDAAMLFLSGTVKNRSQAMDKLARAQRPYNRPSDILFRKAFKRRIGPKLNRYLLELQKTAT
jgi:hypothetical protein